MSTKIPQRAITPIVAVFTSLFVVALSLLASFAATNTRPVSAATLCGEGSAPDYGFTYDLQQAHWTVGWQGYASEGAVSEVDVILDRLNEDAIAQTMILILPEAEVGNRVNCAVHFLRYMKLGLPTGGRKDNGFVFLIVVEPESIDVHYGVGLGLPALTAHELTTLNRAAEDAYEPGQNMDQALLTLVEEFDTVARSNYEPLPASPPPFESDNQARPLSGSSSVWFICGQICLVACLVVFLLWLATMWSRLSPPGWGGGWPGGWSGGSGWGRGGWSGGGWSGGGGWGSSGSRSRGGSGSGRSGRGN